MDSVIKNPVPLLVAGAGLLLADYYDRTYFLTRDLQEMSRFLSARHMLRRRKGREYTYADYWEERWPLHATKAAIKFEGVTYTFSDVEHAINRLSHWLLAQHVTNQDVVAVMLDNRPEHVFSWMSVCKIGARVSLINHNFRSSLLLNSLTQTQSKYLIIGYELANEIGKDEIAAVVAKGITVMVYGGSIPGLLHIDATLRDMPYTPPPRSLRAGQTLSSVFGYSYSSGTTGLPEAATLLHKRLFAISVFFPTVYEITSDDVIYSPLPLYHYGGMLAVGIMMHTGATLCIARRFRASRYWADIVENDVTVIQYVGELCRYLLHLPPTPLDHSHRVRLALGSGLRADIFRPFQVRFAILDVLEYYMSTRGVAYMANRVQLSSGDGTGAVGHFGPLLQRTKRFVLARYDRMRGELVRDGRGRCVLQTGRGRVGELLWKLPNVGSDGKSEKGGESGNGIGNGTESGGKVTENDGNGIENDGKVTKNEGIASGNETKHVINNGHGVQAMLQCRGGRQVATDVVEVGDRYMRTGDLFEVDGRGFYYFVDRIADNFTWKGEAVSASMVAHVLLSHPGILDASVYGVRLPGIDGQPAMAAIVCDPSNPLDLASLGKHVWAELPKNSVPMFLRVLPRMQYTWTLSHRKVELRDQGADPQRVGGDPMYFFDKKDKVYRPLERATYGDIVGGGTRL